METEYKGLLIVSNGRLKQIKAKGKGSVKKELRGLYTSELEAKKAIDKSEGSTPRKTGV